MLKYDKQKSSKADRRMGTKQLEPVSIQESCHAEDNDTSQNDFHSITQLTPELRFKI